MSIFDRLAHAVHEERPAVLVTRLDDGGIGAKLLVFEDDAREDDLFAGVPGLVPVGR